MSRERKLEFCFVYTVESMLRHLQRVAGRQRRHLGEYEHEIYICEDAVERIVSSGALETEASVGRDMIRDVLRCGSVQKWVAQFEAPKPVKP